MLRSNGSSQEKRGTRLQSTFPPFMAANKVKPLVKTQSKNTLKWGGAFNNEDLQTQIKREEQRKQRKVIIVRSPLILFLLACRNAPKNMGNFTSTRKRRETFTTQRKGHNTTTTHSES